MCDEFDLKNIDKWIQTRIYDFVLFLLHKLDYLKKACDGFS